MPKVEVSLPDRIESEIQQLVDQGEFVNRDQAVEELLTRGISAYGVGGQTTDEPEEEGLFSQTVEDQQDPAMRNEQSGDDYTF
jgi:Arc/MetJ-type ribon-helix-helix transcriptional regulator